MDNTKEIRVLDSGYVKLVESWGSDERIIEAARMSTNKGFKGWGDARPCNKCDGTGRMWDNGDKIECDACDKGTLGKEGDERLLSYLWNNKHATPFEMAGMVIEVQAPIFVFREWHRHRTQSYNELSARYTQLPDLYYVPSIERLMAGKQAQSNKQSSEGGFTREKAISLRQDIHNAYQDARFQYEKLLAQGVAKELARLVIPVSQYSRMRASANLRNWLSFLTLRTAEGAQWEIRQYANAVALLIQELFPRTYQLAVGDPIDYRANPKE